MAIVTHLGTNLDWIAFKNGHNQFTITFLQNGSAFDISNYTFVVNIKEPGSSVNKLQLIEGTHLTNGGETGILTIPLTQTQASTTLPKDYYFYEILYTINVKVYPLFQAGLTLSSESNPGSATNVNVPVSLGGVNNITANITITEGGEGGDIDGGFAASVYLPDQIINGGNA